MTWYSALGGGLLVASAFFMWAEYDRRSRRRKEIMRGIELHQGIIDELDESTQQEGN